MGANIRFIHCSDLHLGSRFVGISSDDPKLGKRLTESTLLSFRRIVDLAISESADLMVISGDVFDEENESPATKYAFVKELERLNIPCFISLGNHDFKRSWDVSIPYPSNVHVFSGDPESITVDINGEKVEVVGRSFTTRHTSENLAASLRGSHDAFSIGVVHCNLESVSDDDRYAPCKISDLLGKNIDYWALGHIHKRSELYSSPHIIYPGNIQGRNRTESGEKGAYLVTVKNGSIQETRFVPTQEILWQDISVDITDKNYNELVEDIVKAAKKNSILSITITGKGELDPAIRLDTDGLIKTVTTATSCVVSSIDLRTSPPIDISSLENNDLLSKIDDAAKEFLDLPKQEMIDLVCSTKLSSDIRYVFEQMSEDELNSIIEDAEMLLIDLLRGGQR